MREVIVLVVHVVSVFLRLVQPGRVARSGRRICSYQTSIVDSQAFAEACAESPHPGSFGRGILFALDSAEKASSFGDRIQTVDVAKFSSRDGAAQVSVAVFAKTAKETRSEGPDGGLDPGRRRDEEAQSDMGKSTNR